MTPAAIYALVIIGCLLLAWLCWRHVKQDAQFTDSELSEPLDGWPRMNVGGGYEWPDGRVTRDVDGLEYLGRWDEPEPVGGKITRDRNRQ